jgi:hypothetical protein
MLSKNEIIKILGENKKANDKLLKQLQGLFGQDNVEDNLVYFTCNWGNNFDSNYPKSGFIDYGMNNLRNFKKILEGENND